MDSEINDGVILAARLLLAALFLIFGWRKLTDYSGTVKRMVQDGAPMPVLASVIAIFMELPVHSRSLLERSRVFQQYSWLYTHWEVRSSRIAIGQSQARNKVDSMESFYKNSA